MTHMNKQHVSAVVLAVLAGVVLMLGASAANADTISYWRFEGSDSAWLDDSSGNSHTLSKTTVPGSTDPAQVALSGTGRGSKIHDPIPQTGVSNDYAAEFFNSRCLIAADHSDFNVTDLTIEAYLHVDAFSQNAHTLAGKWRGDGNKSWLFQIQDTGKLKFKVSVDGTASSVDVDSTFTVATGKDYYAAVSYDQDNTASGGTFYLQNLTDNGDLLSESFAHSGVTSYDSLAPVVIGGANVANGVFWARGDGLIDEVRISNSVVSKDDLLAVPEPSTLALLLFGGLALLVVRRLRKR